MNTGQLQRNSPRGSYHAPYVYGREQTPPVPAERPRTVGQQSSALPTHHADVAQAGLFTELLRAEHAELGAVAGIGARRCGGPHATEQMLQLQARMREVRQLLDALEKRFLSS